jgi:hypothetical protein
MTCTGHEKYENALQIIAITATKKLSVIKFIYSAIEFIEERLSELDFQIHQAFMHVYGS